jgi:hypothetical protein
MVSKECAAHPKSIDQTDFQKVKLDGQVNDFLAILSRHIDKHSLLDTLENSDVLVSEINSVSVWPSGIPQKCKYHPDSNQPLCREKCTGK